MGKQKVDTTLAHLEVRRVAANKKFTMQGKEYEPGDEVDVKGLPDHKISQLLNQRYLRPLTPTPIPG